MTKLVKLIGFPLGHSVSPAMQNAAFKELGLDYQYELEEVAPDKLEEAVERLKKDPNVAGFNVTVPYKEKVLAYIDDIVPFSKHIGAINTVVKENGRLKGHNTDGGGFIASLEQNIDPDLDFEIKNKNIVVLGAGGASRAITVALLFEGPSSITIADIDINKAQTLARHLKSLLNSLSNKKKISIQDISLNKDALQKAIDQSALLVNATPIGMHPNIEQSPLQENIKLHKDLVVYDLVYNPAETKLLKQAKAAGAKAISGLDMLVHQGALAFKIWTGQKAPYNVMRQTAQQALYNNI